MINLLNLADCEQLIVSFITVLLRLDILGFSATVYS